MIFKRLPTRTASSFAARRVRDQVSAVFEAAVDQIRRSNELWELSENLGGEAKRKVLANREQVLERSMQQSTTARGG